MKIRSIHLGDSKKLELIKKKFGFIIENMIPEPTIYLLSELNSTQTNILAKIRGQNQLNSRLIAGGKKEYLVVRKSFEADSENLHKSATEDSELAGFFEKILTQNTMKREPRWEFNGRALDFNDGPFIMGILNVTPDSFSDGGKYLNREKALEHALKMVDDGADILDIGGESTRPGAVSVSAGEEIERVIPLIDEVRKQSDTILSIDTYKSEVAEAALKAGAHMINDISGGTFDKNMGRVAGDAGCPMVVMHIKGTPKNMQKNPYYEDVIEEIYDYFWDRIKVLNRQNVTKIIIDPGIGFGKRLEDNLTIIKDLKDFEYLTCPVMIGLSRKSFLGQITGKDTANRLAGTQAANYAALESGANILRVHDVTETKDLVSVFKYLRDI